MTEPLILITGGHDAREGGSTQADGGKEYKYTLPLAQEVQEALLAGWQCRVQLTRTTDEPLTKGGLGDELYARANMANTLGAAFYLTLHHDASPKPEVRGGSLYIHTQLRYEHGKLDRRRLGGKSELAWLDAAGTAPDGKVNHDAPKSFALAQEGMPIIRDTLAELGIPWRGSIMCADFAELRYPNCPCWLIETHFGTNPQDDEIMDQPGNRRQLAMGIARAVAVAMKLAPQAHEPALAPVSASTPAIIAVQVVLLNGAVVVGEKRGDTTLIPVGNGWQPVREIATAVGAQVVPTGFDGDFSRAKVEIVAPALVTKVTSP
jgi:N-acetylmuramoyl-L-alanine amidase